MMPSEGNESMFSYRIQNIAKLYTCASVQTAVQTISAGGEKKMPIRILQFDLPRAREAFWLGLAGFFCWRPSSSSSSKF
jgi:hypothetical protein